MTVEVTAPVAETPITGGNQTVVVTPPVVTPPVAEDKKVVVQLGQEAEPVVEPITYDPTGDAGLDIALDFVGNLGFAASHPAMQAAEKGDFTLLEFALGQLGDKAKGWEKYVNLGKTAYTNATNATQATADAVTAAVVEVAGGKEQWETIQKWASANADPKEKADINAMFDAGPFQARAAAKILLDAYNGAAGTTVVPSKATVKDPGGSTPAASNGPLDRKAYAKAVADLARVKGNQLDGSPEYLALQQRRQQYRG